MPSFVLSKIKPVLLCKYFRNVRLYIEMCVFVRSYDLTELENRIIIFDFDVIYMYVYSIRIENAEIDISLLVNKYFAETTFFVNYCQK